MDYESLTGIEKAAIVILSLPPETVGEFLPQLPDEDVHTVLAAVSRIEEIPPGIQDRVLSEFQGTLGKRDYSIAGGRKRALELLNHTLDGGRATEILEKLGRDEIKIDWTLRAYQPIFVAKTIADEHPQTIALMMSQLPADRGALVIESLPEEIRADVVLRLATLETVTTDVIVDIEEGVAEIFERSPVASTRVGGTAVAAQVLNRISKSDGTSILEGVDTRDPEIAGAIRKRMLTFNDLEAIDRRGFQLLLREVSTDDLALALKTSSPEMLEKVYGNMSSRAVEQIKEEIELLGPVKLAEVERVQEEIVETARRLEERGDLSIDVGGSSDVLV